MLLAFLVRLTDRLQFWSIVVGCTNFLCIITPSPLHKYYYNTYNMHKIMLIFGIENIVGSFCVIYRWDLMVGYIMSYTDYWWAVLVVQTDGIYWVFAGGLYCWCILVRSTGGI